MDKLGGTTQRTQRASSMAMAFLPSTVLLCGGMQPGAHLHSHLSQENALFHMPRTDACYTSISCPKHVHIALQKVSNPSWGYNALLKDREEVRPQRNSWGWPTFLGSLPPTALIDQQMRAAQHWPFPMWAAGQKAQGKAPGWGRTPEWSCRTSLPCSLMLCHKAFQRLFF